MNRRGMTAFVDTMVFLVIMMVAAGVVLTVTAETQVPEAHGVSAQIRDAEYRLSDLDPDGDDTLVRVTDLIEMDAASGSTMASDVLKGIMDAYCKGRPYSLTADLDGEQVVSVGVVVDSVLTSHTSEVETPTGSVVRMTVTIGS